MKRVRGLESIYLQRLEPAKKGTKNWYTGQGNTSRRARFRDCAKELLDNPLDEYDKDDDSDIRSLVSESFKKTFKSKNISSNNRSQAVDEFRPNIFAGNYNQYIERQR